MQNDTSVCYLSTLFCAWHALAAWISSLCRGYGDVGRLLTSVAAAGRHGNEYNNNNGGGGAVREDADGRRLLSGSKPAAGPTGDDVDRPLNLEVHKRLDTKLDRPDSHNVERDSISGKRAITSKVKHAIKLKTSPARLAQLLQPSLGRPCTVVTGGLIKCS